ncbi:MAG: ribose-phosphate diphosphokinase [Bacteroidota bacterium]
MTDINTTILFHTANYEYLAKKVATCCSAVALGEVELDRFSDGERYQRIVTEIEGKNVALLGGTIDDPDTLELYDLASALVSYGCNQLQLIVPYYGYSTMERAVKAREVVTAKTRARLLSSIPGSVKGNRIYLFDLHSEGIPHYFENQIHPVHVYCKEIVMEAARKHCGNDFILASTDAGRAKWVESLANDMGVNAAFVLKRRLRDDETTVTAINADVEGRDVIIYDDMIRSGGSILHAAQAYTDAGARRILVITTHGLFIQGGIEKMRRSGLIEKVICMDTHPNVNQINDDFVEVHSIDKLIARLL